jgi:hypothetical protein
MKVTRVQPSSRDELFVPTGVVIVGCRLGQGRPRSADAPLGTSVDKARIALAEGKGVGKSAPCSNDE